MSEAGDAVTTPSDDVVTGVNDADDRRVIRVGSRQSCLAMIQTNYVISELRLIYPDHKFDIETMDTIGDKNLDKALPEIGDKGLFTQELESALLDHKVDFIVHSLKDLPTSLPPNCSIGAILQRECPADVLVLRKGVTLQDPFSLITGTAIFDSSNDNHHTDFVCNTSNGSADTQTVSTSNGTTATSNTNNDTKDNNNDVQQEDESEAKATKRVPLIIGSSSLRRQSQLKRFNPVACVMNVRGNINTRLNKLDGVWKPPAGRHAQHYDALILAASGLKRGGFEDRISYVLGQKDATNGSQDWYYAVGQGALVIECRQHDEFMHKFLEPLTHRKTIYETLAERSLLLHLEGGCSVPIGVRTEWSGQGDNDIRLMGAIFSVDGKTEVSGEISGSLVTRPPDDHDELKVKRQKVHDNLMVGLPILPTSCPVLKSNYEICFKMGQDLAHELQAKGGTEILHEIRVQKEREKEKRMQQKPGGEKDSQSGSDDANSSFEPM
jgi:porphobilinogen deaminase